MIEIKKLPSGFWSVWVDGKWVYASLPSEQAATEQAKWILRSMQGVKK